MKKADLGARTGQDPGLVNGYRQFTPYTPDGRETGSDADYLPSPSFSVARA